LRTEHLTKIYGKDDNEVIAVNNINLSVARGEFVAIVGSSGSGKSTLLHLLGGVDRPTSGRVLIEDKDIYQMDSDGLAVFRRRQVGLIYQFYNLIPVLNVEENMTLPCELDGRKPDAELVRELAVTLGLEKRMRHLPNELSGGQQQRVAIGRALITRPAILLADEPTGNLDSRASDEIMTLLEEANRRYKQTIIMITHNAELAKRADRVLVIEDGCISGGQGVEQ
ncbi:MAG: ABC transporter ATP-binding protein, partial [Acetatifactor sp.]|nr:ABC transporter ATP-binding protein [Acetatifactor sp.]